MALVIFTEEESMKATLETLLPQLDVDPRDASQVMILSHEGKSDLEKSWRTKLPNWRTPNTSFLILRDADGGDCHAIKQGLQDVAAQCGKTAHTMVRIVCQELEAWFLGDPDALRAAGYLKQNQSPNELRTPDDHVKPSEILRRWNPQRQKVNGAREIAQHMDVANNTSLSFNHAINAIRQLAG